MSKLVDIDVEVIFKTESNQDIRAWLVTTDGDNRIWIPASQCEVELKKDGKAAVLTCSEHLAKEKGMI